MLLAVEGGRFFSSSATGYSNGLSLLLLGQKKEEKPMRVTPWAQYHLVDQGTDPNLQLAANKSCGACRCASLTCFGCAATGLESPSVGPAQNQQDVVKSSSRLEKVDENSQPSNLAEGDGDGDTNGVNAVSLKSSLKKRASTVTVTVSVAENKCDEVEPEPVHQSARRSVHWTDVTGGELCEIREFEPSEHSDSDDEFENNTGKTCSCTIM
ncbi:putative light-harvesting complex-like protein OHP2 [Helianthus annuus]|nr:putative light-harvesting complex-like protein OHP2 [Helianthus annuus]